MIHIEEVRKAVKQMKCNIASGGDGIPAEVYNHGGGGGQPYCITCIVCF